MSRADPMPHPSRIAEQYVVKIGELHLNSDRPHVYTRPIRPGLVGLVAHAVMAKHLGHGLVPSTPLMSLAVREQPIDNHADDGEQEDDERPNELRDGRARRL